MLHAARPACCQAVGRLGWGRGAGRGFCPRSKRRGAGILEWQQCLCELGLHEGRKGPRRPESRRRMADCSHGSEMPVSPTT